MRTTRQLCSPLESTARRSARPTRRTVLELLALATAATALPGSAGFARAASPSGGRNGVDPAPGYPAPLYLESNGITMGVYEQGEGVPLVFCHGFPELAYSWRHQLAAFSEAGYRVVIPDQRGYGLTDRPEPIEAYRLDQLCLDLVGVLDALDIERAVFVGHDWGGGVVWMMPRFHPERVAGVVGVNTPASDPRHPRQPSEPSLIVQSDRYYTRTFQEPGVADAALAADVRKTFEFVMRRGGIWNVDAFAKLPEDSPERRMDLLAMLEKGDFGGEMFLTEEELAYFVDTFEATGFTGGLKWYRAAAGGIGDAAATARWDIEVPCLYVGAEHDVILRPSSADGMERFVADLEKHTILDCGHWTQQEKPEELNRLILDWLGRKVG